MSEDKKQDDFLSGHEELLNSLHKKAEEKATENEEVPAAEEPVEEAAPVVEEPIAEAEPVVEEEPEPAPVVEEPEPEPVVEEEPEPVVEEEPEVVAEEPEPIVEEEPEPAPVVEEPEPEPVAEEEPEVVVEKPVPEVPPVVKVVPAKVPPKPKKPATPTEAAKRKHDALEKAEVKEVLNFINKYVKPSAIVIVVICGLFLFNSLTKNSRLKKEAAADAALMSARSGADYQAILDNYGKTPSAALALMALAQETFNAGQPAEAQTLYEDFLKKHKGHASAVQAEFNLIACKEAMGQYGDASILYEDFKSKHPESHLAPVALLAKARCLEATDNFAAAKTVYEDIVTFYPGSGWSSMAESQLRVVESKIK